MQMFAAALTLASSVVTATPSGNMNGALRVTSRSVSCLSTWSLSRSWFALYLSRATDQRVPSGPVCVQNRSRWSCSYTPTHTHTLSHTLADRRCAGPQASTPSGLARARARAGRTGTTTTPRKVTNTLTFGLQKWQPITVRCSGLIRETTLSPTILSNALRAR